MIKFWMNFCNPPWDLGLDIRAELGCNLPVYDGGRSWLWLYYRQEEPENIPPRFLRRIRERDDLTPEKH